MTEPNRAECSVCGRAITIKNDGTLRHHANPNAPRWHYQWRSPLCGGAGRKPKEQA